MKKTLETLNETVEEMKQFMQNVQTNKITNKELLKGDYDKALSLFSSFNYNFNHSISKATDKDILDYLASEYIKDDKEYVKSITGGRLNRMALILNGIIERNTVYGQSSEQDILVDRAIALLENITEFKGRWTSDAVKKQIQNKARLRTEKLVVYYGDPKVGHIRILNIKSCISSRLFHKLSLPFDANLFVRISEL